MKAFEIFVKNGKICGIYDNRYAERIDITNGKGAFGCICYTRRDEDVNAMPKRNFLPHAQYLAELSVSDNEKELYFTNEELGVSCEISQEEAALRLHWTYRNTCFSKFAAYLPLNFSSQKNGHWKSQFLVSSPCYDPQAKRTTCMFTRPDGNHLMLVVATPTAAFRIDYGANSHFIDGFEIIENLDKSYGANLNDSGEIIAYLVPVNSYEEGLAATAKLLNIPCAHYEISSAMIGEEFSSQIIGDCDRIVVIDPEGEETNYPGDTQNRILARTYGFYKVVPYRNGKKGMECICFAHYPWQKMHEKSIESIPVHRDKPLGTMADGTTVWMPPYAQYRGYVDSNLCEHTMWAWSQLRYMRHFSVSREAADNLANVLNVILADNVSAYRPRQTLIAEQQSDPRTMCAFNTYKSDRIQEAFNGANVLLAAWQLYGEKRYLEQAVSVIDAILQHNFQDGCIFRNLFGNHPEDYTTVTAMILPVADLYTELSAIGDIRAEKFRNYAEMIADFVVCRDMDFPTESTKTDEYNTEYEDGSISCSALTVLYVAWNVVYKPEYIAYAEKVLFYHDAFTVYVCNAPMFHSSLRWWETLWEGDADGPVICCGHAWTIWQAEAEFWLGLAKKDPVRLKNSYNGFMSNFAKQDSQGDMYAIYQCEPCSSGAYSEAKDVSRYCAVGFPETKDTTLSRYAYARGYDTWLRCTAVFADGCVLNGQMRNGKLQSTAPYFSMLYIESLNTPITIKTDGSIQIFCSKPLQCVKGKIIQTTDFGFLAQPDIDSELVLAANNQEE